MTDESRESTPPPEGTEPRTPRCWSRCTRRFRGGVPPRLLSAALEQTLSFETRIRKSRLCITETFFNSLLDQKAARLPAAPEDEGLAAKPRAIVKI